MRIIHLPGEIPPLFRQSPALTRRYRLRGRLHTHVRRRYPKATGYWPASTGMVATGDADKGGHRLAEILAECLQRAPQDGAYPFADGSTADSCKEQELLLIGQLAAKSSTFDSCLEGPMTGTDGANERCSHGERYQRLNKPRNRHGPGCAAALE